MNKYKINYIYNDKSNNNLNDICIKTLKKELDIFIRNGCKKSNKELTSTHTYLSLQEKEDKNNV